MSLGVIKSCLKMKKRRKFSNKEKNPRNYQLLIQGLVNSFLDFTSPGLL